MDERDAPQIVVEATANRLRAVLQTEADPERRLASLTAMLEGSGVEQWLLHARALLVLGFLGEATQLLSRTAGLWPDHTEVRYWLGNALRSAKHGAAAETLFRSVLRSDPRHEGAAASLAYMLRDQARMEAAAQVVVALRRAQGGGLQETLRCGKFLQECRRYALAAEVYEDEIAHGCSDPQILFEAGDVALIAGAFERARVRLLSALNSGLDTDRWSGIFLLLANAQRYSSRGHSDAALFESVHLDEDRPATTRACAGFALGKLLDDAGEYADAAVALREANRLERPNHTWSAAAWSERIRIQSKRCFPGVWSSVPQGAAVPVFVVGLPRSGTTVLAERLSRHPLVKVRGELTWIPFLHQQLIGNGGLMDAGALRSAAQIYLAHLRQDDAPARWYIDKNPLNFLHLPMIAAMFPWARIIHCRRDLPDVALSLWAQHFAHEDNGYAYDTTSIADFIRGYERIVQRWRGAVAVAVLDVQYERLVEDPAAVLSETGEFLGLEDATALTMLPPTTIDVATASVWQARQPLYRSSIGRWRHYAAHDEELAALFAALGATMDD
jgi:tetratricopeptide (TPR) repeat protein